MTYPSETKQLYSNNTMRTLKVSTTTSAFANNADDIDNNVIAQSNSASY